MAKPNPQYIPHYYIPYINLVQEDNVTEALRNSSSSFAECINMITPEKENYRYSEGKWTVKEVLLHIIDTERIYNYRALCIARGETAKLPGFDEKHYALNSEAKKRSLISLAEEFAALRMSTIELYKSLSDEILERLGNANGFDLTVNLLGFVSAGHQIHHQNVIIERYLAAQFED